MSRSNGNGHARKRRSEQFGRTSLTASLVQAMRATGTRPSRAAKLLGVTDRTLRRWLKLETAVESELVLNAPRLAKTFARCLSVTATKRERAEKKAA